jgi:large subunit ribosomal protein L23
MKNVLKMPLLTEKSNNLRLDSNQYTFLVDTDANKIEVAKEIKRLFNVDVVSVNIVNHPGKQKSRFIRSGRINGKTAKFKKAIVKIKDGQTIELFEQI